MSEQEPLVFESITLTEIPVEIAGEPYILREATADDARKWRANNLQSMQMEERGKGRGRVSHSTFKSEIANSHLLLVSLCLFKLDGERRIPVSMDTLRGWKNSVVEALFRKARDISDLDEDDDEDSEKNSQETSGSGPKSPDESADTP